MGNRPRRVGGLGELIDTGPLDVHRRQQCQRLGAHVLGEPDHHLDGSPSLRCRSFGDLQRSGNGRASRGPRWAVRDSLGNGGGFEAGRAWAVVTRSGLEVPNVLDRPRAAPGESALVGEGCLERFEAPLGHRSRAGSGGWWGGWWVRGASRRLKRPSVTSRRGLGGVGGDPAGARSARRGLAGGGPRVGGQGFVFAVGEWVGVPVPGFTGEGVATGG
jgi:hypothetical protein